MSKLSLALAASVLILMSSGLVGAAELPLPNGHAVAAGRAPAECGPCGCLQVTYEYHRDIQTTYGLGFDPRNYDTTEPHFYLGRLKAYPRYWVDGMPARSAC